MGEPSIGWAEVHELLGRWWYRYDEGDFDAMREMLTDDTEVRVRTDSGTTDFEDFIRADVAGIDDVMAWYREHRLDSPYPLRHHGTNIHITGSDATGTAFASYIYVTNVVGIMPGHLSSGVVSGVVRNDGGSPKFASMEVKLDMTESVNLRDRR